jgi:hypothetical protein
MLESRVTIGGVVRTVETKKNRRGSRRAVFQEKR